MISVDTAAIEVCCHSAGGGEDSVTVYTEIPAFLWWAAPILQGPEFVSLRYCVALATVEVRAVALTSTAGTGEGMLLVPAGEFTMGSDKGDSDEKPAHTVYLDAFTIDRYEVTNAEYAKFLNAGNGDHWDSDQRITRSGSTYTPVSGKENHPVVYVGWFDADAYCKWAGKRLPTEAEWEKTARGTDGRTYPWGSTFDRTRLNSWKGGPHTTTPVGNYPQGAGPSGAMDMAGNVWEWCADWYDGNYYSRSPKNNPGGLNTGSSRVLRGGSWCSYPNDARASYRNWSVPAYRNYSVGFRGGSVLPG